MAGFLERQRLEKEARDRQLAQEEEARKRQRMENKQRSGRYERTLQLQELATGYLRESGIVSMASKLVGFNYTKRDMEQTAITPTYKSEGAMGFVVQWDRKPIPGSGVYFTGFEIEGDPNGIIFIKGGFWGSTTLTVSKWKGRLDVVESALEKAYNHPKSLREEFYSSDPNPRM